jgi:hypothetical protein
VIIYSQRTKSFIPNPLNRVGLDSYDKAKLKADPDGSVYIYFGDSAASGYGKNWLPSAREDFFVIFRFYGLTDLRQDLAPARYRARPSLNVTQAGWAAPSGVPTQCEASAVSGERNLSARVPSTGGDLP